MNLFYMIAIMGFARFRETVLFGQYRYPKGLYYGGTGFERSALIMQDLFSEAVVNYNNILLIDMHSGYGPRYQMTLVNSIHEKRSSVDLQEIFDYPLIVKTDPEEFYQIQGDMVDFYYLLINERFPHKHFFGTSFEFGTYGESLVALINSHKTMINENRLFHFGAINEKTFSKAKRDFEELYNPSEECWREKALQDARRAFLGILKAEIFSS